MYFLINVNISDILKSIELDHVKKYDWLIKNIHQIKSSNYQTSYKTFWRLHGAGLSNEYCSTYFQFLNRHLQKPIEMKELIKSLYNGPVNSSGRKSLRFHLQQKCCALGREIRQHPLLDSLISSFYFFKPNRRLSFDKRVEELIKFYKFLKYEYNRILKNSLLQKSIETFRVRFKPLHFTDEKIIDSLIWAFTSYSFKGAVIDKNVVFC
ncbi:MAG: hypothetical protein SRB2_04853 [Desulfobacteraceae bacterium Eth-SRB2]|nr:MAG: hypothetical protein SRB2_04853 [Desulfobacteraceae bacterium Eth-SRB2]